LNIKRILFSILILFLNQVFFAQQITDQIRNNIKNEQKYFSEDNSSFAIPVEFSTSVDHYNSGIYLNLDNNEYFINIEYLVGVGFVEWLPEDNFLIIDNGTSPFRSFIVIDLKKISITGYIPYFANEYSIVDKDTVISTGFGGYKIDNLVDMFGIFYHKIIHDYIFTEQILEPDELTNYRLINVTNNIIKYTQINYENTGTPSPWERYKKTSEINKEISLKFDKTYGVLNDSRVRVRKEPNLNGEHITFIDKAQIVEILEITNDKMKIDNMESEWYKVKTDSGLIGWSYGFFIDVLDN